MKWISISETKPQANRKCLVKIEYDNKYDYSIGYYQNRGGVKTPDFHWYSGCCHDLQDVAAWIYFDEILNEISKINHG